MTTIATDGKTIASDSLMVGGYIDQVQAKKLWRIGDKIVGGAGAYTSVLEFVEWAKDGFNPDKKPSLPEDSFEALMVTKSKILYFDNRLIAMVPGRPASIGSGTRFAMGAMLAGADPRQAVNIAKRLDTNTGGKTVVMEIGCK